MDVSAAEKKARLSVAYDALDAATAGLADDAEAVNALIGFAAKIASYATLDREQDVGETREAFMRLAGQWFDMAMEAAKREPESVS